MKYSTVKDGEVRYGTSTYTYLHMYNIYIYMYIYIRCQFGIRYYILGTSMNTREQNTNTILIHIHGDKRGGVCI